MSLITKKLEKKFSEINDILTIIDDLDQLQMKKNYDDTKMNSDLNVVLWKAYVYNNIEECEGYYYAKKILENIKEQGIKNALWCYEYAFSLFRLREFEDALIYLELAINLEPSQSKFWLEKSKIYFFLNHIKKAKKTIDEALKLFPKNKELANLKENISNNNRSIFFEPSFNDKKYNLFLNFSELERKLNFLHFMNKHQEIIDIINNLPINEKNNKIIGILARAYNNIEKYDEALEILFPLKDECKNDAIWNYRIGYSYVHLEKFNEARVYFEKALELDENTVDANIFLLNIYNVLGSEQIEKENYIKALEYYKKALAIAKTDEDIINENCYLAWTYDILNDYKTAQKYIDKIFESGKDDIWINVEQGICLEGQQNYEDAFKFYNKALLLGRDDSWINFKLGLCLEVQENYEDALLYFEKAKELESKENILLCAHIAYNLKNIGKFNEALKYYIKAEELGRNDLWIVSEIAETLENLDKIEDAINKLESSNFKDTYELISVYSQLGHLYGKINNSEKALFNLFNAEKLDRKDIWIFSEIGWNFLNLSKYSDAIEYYKKAIQLGRNDFWINSNIGFTLSKLDRNKEAVEYLENAYFADESDEWNIYILAWTYQKLGEIDKAIKFYEKVVNSRLYKEWVHAKLALCYALIDNKNKSKEYLEKTEKMIKNEEYKMDLKEIEKDLATTRELLSSIIYIN